MAYETTVTQEDEQNKKRGMIISVAIHVVMVMLALLPLLTFPDPPPGQEGILVNLGLPDQGQGIENAGPATPEAEEEPEQPREEAATPPPTKSEPEPQTPEKEVITTEDPNEVAIRKEKERQKQAEEARKERERQEQLEKERQRQAELDRQRQEQARKEKEAADFKENIGGLFGEGEGKGNTGTSGNQGDPGGDPDASKLEGISTGSGLVGGGLGNRGVARSHKPQDTSQDQGSVVVKVCVDRAGKVISAEFTQRGSTATSSRLKQLAVNSAQQWRFQPGDVDKQCGTITYRFVAK